MKMSIGQDHISRKAIRCIEYGGLFIITVCTLIAGSQELINMVNVGKVRLADLLLLFLYLEVIAMVGVYLESGKLPVRMPIYIGIVALARYLALDGEGMQTWKIIAVASAITLLAFAVLIIRYGHIKYPYSRRHGTEDEELID
jgi:protein PsiE